MGQRNSISQQRAVQIRQWGTSAISLRKALWTLFPRVWKMSLPNIPRPCTEAVSGDQVSLAVGVSRLAQGHPPEQAQCLSLGFPSCSVSSAMSTPLIES